ncbi:MAG: oxygenase MpaB family protein [Segniliparus sp.]|uniref:oxygenase MpaB family protein n=1 Tax=Segniliparus sp. TaxID=2804064 RepID=UPI003F377D63
MTDISVNPDAQHACPGLADSDLVVADVKVGNNKYHAGTRIPDRPNDDSLRPKDRAQHTVPPHSLLWKYMGDPFVLGAVGQRLPIMENMWPQLGQGVSDHSVLVAKGDFRSLRERAANSLKAISGVVYATPEEATTYGIQVRNFHKSIKGEMPNGRRYHAIDAETFYWAHVTFFEAIYRAGELGVIDLSWEEKEQIFEESKFWFSLYGVDDRAQPKTYADFEAYFADVKANQLIDMGIAQYTAGSAKTADYMIRAAPPKVRKYVRLAAPAIAAGLRLSSMGHLEPELLERLRLTEYWTAKDQRRYRRFLKLLRVMRTLSQRLHLPLRFRYMPFAAQAFEREGVNPDDITLESARRALAEARAARPAKPAPANSAAPPEAIPSQIAPAGATCAKCERQLEDCVECQATGLVEGEPCDVCDGAQKGCPVHHAQWRTPAVA